MLKPFFYCCAFSALLRSISLKRILRIRINFGVISTYSSSRIYSKASSNENFTAVQCFFVGQDCIEVQSLDILGAERR